MSPTRRSFAFGLSIFSLPVLLSWNFCVALSTPPSQANMSNISGPLDETSDRLNRWLGRWSENKLGWHQKDVHPCLAKYGTEPAESCPAEGLRWLVTLCGKTKDMHYIATQETTAHVVGVDGIRKALDEFAEEHPDLEIESDDNSAREGTYERLSGKKISLLKGDFFALDETAAGGRFDVIWDRASMVAIQPNLREEYVKTISKNIKPGGKILLVTIDKRTGEEEGMSKGPPFSVPESEVRRLNEGQDWVESVTLLEEVDEFEAQPDMKERFVGEGVTSMYELYFLIQVK